MSEKIAQGDSPLPMPDSATGAATGPQLPVSTPQPPASSWPRQLAQLVVIPALIVAAAAAAWLVWGLFIGSGAGDIDLLLAQLRHTPSAEEGLLGLHTPSSRTRWQAADAIARKIRTIEDPDQRRRISSELESILANVGDGQPHLTHYLLLAVGRLGQPHGIEAIGTFFDSSEMIVHLGCLRGLASSPDLETARQLIPQVIEHLDNPHWQVQMEAAITLGHLGRPENLEVVEALAGTIDPTASDHRDVVWNAAVALARLGDERGLDFVIEVLLNRKALSRLSAKVAGPGSIDAMSSPQQDRVMTTTIGAAAKIDDPRLWQKLEQIAEEDPSRSVRQAAAVMLGRRPRT